MPGLDELLASQGKPQAQAPSQVQPSTPQAGTGLDALLAGKQSTGDKITENYKMSLGTDSSKNAQVQGLAKEHGVSEGFVERNLPAMKAASQALTPDQLAKHVQDSPVLANHLQDPKTMAAVHDQIPLLSGVESQFRVAGKALNEAAAHSLGYVPFAGQTLHDFFQQKADFISTPELNQDAWAEAKQGNLTPLLSQITSGVVHSLPNIVMFTAGKIPGSVYTFADTAYTAYQENEKQGMGLGANLTEAGIKGAAEVGQFLIPIHYFSSIYKGVANTAGVLVAKEIVKRALINIGAAAGAGFVIGAGSELLNDTLDVITGKNPKALDNVGEKMAQSGATNSAAMVAFGGIQHLALWNKPIPAKGAKVEAPKPPTQEQQGQQISKIVEEIQKSKIVKDNPKIAGDIARSMAESHGVSDVRIPLTEFQAIHGELSDGVASKIGPSTKASYEIAKAGGTAHITIPVSELVTAPEDAKVQDLAKKSFFEPTIDTQTTTEPKPTLVDKAKQIFTPSEKLAEPERQALERMASSPETAKYLEETGGKLTDEMKDFEKRFLATSKEVKMAEKELGLVHEEPAGLNEEDQALWKATRQKALNEAHATLNDAKKEALGRYIKSRTSSERARVTKDVTAEINENPVYKAWDGLEQNYKIADVKQAATDYINGKLTPEAKAAFDQTADHFGWVNGLDMAVDLKNSDREHEIKTRVKAHMDQFKEQMAVNPFDSQLAAMSSSRKKLVAMDIVTERQNQEFLKKKAEAESERIKAGEEKKQEQAERRKVALEGYRKELNEAKRQSARVMSDLPVKDATNTRLFVADVKSYTQQIEKAKTPEEKEQARKNLLVAMENAQASKRMALEVNDAKWRMKKYADTEKKPLQMPRGHWLQIQGILEGMGIKEPQEKNTELHKQVAKMMMQEAQAGKMISASDIADATGFLPTDDGQLIREDLPGFQKRMAPIDPDLAGALKIPTTIQWRDMNTSDFFRSIDAVKAIDHNGKTNNKIELMAGSFTKDVVVSKLIESAKANYKERGIIDFRLATDTFLAHEAMQLPTLCHILDGGDSQGWFHKAINDPLLGGLAEKHRIKYEMADGIKLVEKQFYPNGENSTHNELFNVTTSQGTRAYSKNEIKQMYAYAVQEDGLKALLTGNKYTVEDLRKLFTHIDKNDREFMQNVGANIESYFGAYAKTMLKLDGVEARKANTPGFDVEGNGNIDKGFYYPMRFQNKFLDVLKAAKQNFLSKSHDLYQQNNGNLPFTNNGVNHDFLIDRTGVEGLPLDTVNSPLASHIERVAHYLGMQEPVKNVSKIVNDKRFLTEMDKTLGPSMRKLFSSVLEHVNSGPSGAQDAAEKIMAATRTLYFTHVIAMRPGLLLLKGANDLGNMTFSGRGHQAAADMIRYGGSFDFDLPSGKNLGFANKDFKQLYDTVCAKDPMHKARHDNLSWNAQELARTYNPAEVRQWMERMLSDVSGKAVNIKWTGAMEDVALTMKLNAYVAERIADKNLSTPHWWRVYLEGKANGLSEQQAIMEARKSVNATFGTGEPLYHIGAQRGGELYRQLAPVISFASNQYQLWLKTMHNQELRAKLGNNILSGALIASAATGMYYIYPSAAKFAIKAGLSKDPGKELDLTNKKAQVKAERDIQDELFAGIPLVNAEKEWWLNPTRAFLPGAAPFVEGGIAMHSQELAHEKHRPLSEKEWAQQIDALGALTGTPSSFEVPVMNFMDYLHHQNNGFTWQDMVSKRELPDASRRRNNLLPSMGRGKILP